MNNVFRIRLSDKDLKKLEKKSKAMGVSRAEITRKLIRGEICLSAHENGFANPSENGAIFDGPPVDVERLEDMIKTTARTSMELLILLQKYTDQNDTSLADEARKEQINNFKHRYGE